MISFTVPGVPVAKGRTRITTVNTGTLKGKNGLPGKKAKVRAITPEKTRDYEAYVAALGQIAMRGKVPLTGPLVMTLRIYLPIPSSWSQKKQRAALAGAVYPTTKPDNSNVLKGIEDALNKIAYGDDSCIVDHVVSKRYCSKPRVEVEIKTIGTEP